MYLRMNNFVKLAKNYLILNQLSPKYITSL
jgi:hypothetical protein